MNEAQLYHTDGLFHNIIKQSRIMDGRYAVLPKGSHDLNMNNILSGLDLPSEKYPGVFCLPPISEMQSATGGQLFNFRILFVTTSTGTGDNQIKYIDTITGAAQENPAKDWNDMKVVALSFMQSLEKIQKSFLKEFHLSQTETFRIVRFAQMQNDNLNGVMLMFSMIMYDVCQYSDIQLTDVNVLFPDHETTFH